MYRLAVLNLLTQTIQFRSSLRVIRDELLLQPRVTHRCATSLKLDPVTAGEPSNRGQILQNTNFL